MTLELAIEIALETMDKRAKRVGSDDTYPAEAAAVLRAFMENGLPFYRAAKAACDELDRYNRWDDIGGLGWPHLENLYAAYRALLASR